ncbi:MAG: Rpn family recombination-promoting nuclease/putative transposase [Chitinispirillaceae bacterium]
MKERYLNPFTDFGFKKIFGEEINKDLLIDFLNELLKGEQHIKDLNYKKTENLGTTQIDREAIFDLYCENDRGEKFIVEIQKTKQRFFRDRTVYYSTFPIAEQAEQGDWDYELKAVYTIAILDFTFEDENRDKTIVSHVQLMDTEKKRVFYDKLTFIYLQMPNFNKSEEELETRFDKWLYILKNLPRLHNRPAKLQERVFEKLFSVAEIAKFSPVEIDAYEESLKIYRDLKNALETAKEEGKFEGRDERSTEIAMEMIKNGETDEKTALYTGLSEDTIKKLRKRISL